jgi:hypothetical protein
MTAARMPRRGTLSTDPFIEPKIHMTQPTITSNTKPPIVGRALPEVIPNAML